jgi:hypothetical protein
VLFIERWIVYLGEYPPSNPGRKIPVNIVHQKNSTTVVKGKDRTYVIDRKGKSLTYMRRVQRGTKTKKR